VTDGGPRGALLIAYGNRLRGDDGVAWHVAAAVRAVGGGHRIITAHQLTPELASDVADADCVVFVDAACDVAPGNVAVHPVHPAASPPGGLTQHICDPGALLWFALQASGRAPAAAWLVTVGAESLDHGEGLSMPVEAAVPRASAAVLRLLHQRLSGAATG
jgi:hydrogenase maturation protease